MGKTLDLLLLTSLLFYTFGYCYALVALRVGLPPPLYMSLLLTGYYGSYV